MKLKAGRITVEISHPEKILFPKSKITKEDLANYYLSIAPLMIPLIKDRPISMKRFPLGIKKEGFFQKNAPESLPSWIKAVKVQRKEQQAIHMLLCNEAATLVWLANQNCITPHIWLSRYDEADYPDRMIFDLDPPPKKSFKMVIQAAKKLREILEGELGLKTYVNTTGSRGLHVVVPIKREYDFEKAKAFAHKVAELLVASDPKMYTLEIRKNKRQGRLFVDILRNAYGQTAVAPYAVREYEGAPIATPIFWKELDNSGLTSDHFNIKNIGARIKAKKNPWVDITKKSYSLKSAEKKLEKLLNEMK